MSWQKGGKALFLVFFLAITFLLVSSAQAQKPIELAFALHTAPGGPDHAAVQKFKEMVESKSKNRLKVNIFPGAQLGGGVVGQAQAS
jgi:TRAP-type C4-dicarboxylate transport system substrate-binding protein